MKNFTISSLLIILASIVLSSCAMIQTNQYTGANYTSVGRAYTTVGNASWWINYLDLDIPYYISGNAAASAPVSGGTFQRLKAPLAVVGATDSTKVGKAYCESVLGLVGIGDCSIQAAMKDGNITKINHVSYESLNILGLFARFTVVVYGE